MGWMLNRTVLRGTYRYRHPIRHGVRAALWLPLWRRPAGRRATVTGERKAPPLASLTVVALATIIGWAIIGWLAATAPRVLLILAALTGAIIAVREGNQ